jgi:hypothetical protein
MIIYAGILATRPPSLGLEFPQTDYPAALMGNDKDNYAERWAGRLKIIIFVLMTILAVVLAFKLYKERTKVRPIIQIEKPAPTNQHTVSSPSVDNKPQQENKKPPETRIYKCVSDGKTIYSESPCTPAN